MSQADEEIYRPFAGKEVERYDDAGGDVEWADLRWLTGWLREHKVLVFGGLLILAQLAWKFEFLSHLYFRQDDFHDLDLAIQSPFSWHYLTFIGAGHLIIGLRLVAWILVKISLYNWGLASAVSLAFVAAASIAGLRLLRMLFGERPAILIPLLLYVISPLTLPDLGEWSSALESVPLQLAIFMALAAHVWYIRTGRSRHLVAAAAWVAFGLLFFEKGLVLPALIFVVTSGFMAPARSWLSGMRATVVQYWRAWVAYLALMIGYVLLLAASLHTSTTHPGAPASVEAVARFARGLLGNSLLPGAVGGPWQWLPVSGGSYSFAAPPTTLTWLALVVVLAVMVAGMWRNPRAWRAWVILIGWVAAADMLPVIISRLGEFSPTVLGTETRYVADAVPVMVICLGLAFLPLADGRTVAGSAGGRRARLPASGQAPVNPVAVLVALFVFGSIWSAHAYENVTTGAPAASYIANASAAIKLAPRGTPVMNVAVSGDMVEGLFGSYALQSTVIGDIDRGRLHWIRHPAGTLDRLHIFGSDGRLYRALVHGASSEPLPPGQKCWPSANSRAIVRFQNSSPSYTGILRLGYVWFSSAPGYVIIRYSGGIENLAVRPGLHTGYVPITGSVSRVTVETIGGGGLCIGDAQAGNLGPDLFGPILPAQLK